MRSLLGSFRGCRSTRARCGRALDGAAQPRSGRELSAAQCGISCNARPSREGSALGSCGIERAGDRYGVRGLCSCALALVERVHGRHGGECAARRPRLLWGPSAILSNKYWSEAMRAIGYESLHRDANRLIRRHERSGLGRLPGRFTSATGACPNSFAAYAMFAWALRHGDVFMLVLRRRLSARGRASNGGEYRLLRLAGKRLVVSPYGGDIAVVGHLRGTRAGLARGLSAASRDQAELAQASRPALAEVGRVSVLTTRSPASSRGSTPSGRTSSRSTPSLWRPPVGASDADGRNGAGTHRPCAEPPRSPRGPRTSSGPFESLRAEGLEIDLQDPGGTTEAKR